MLNHSCTRCRQKKLRCNGQIPCNNCSRKNLDDECMQITRKARPRKINKGGIALQRMRVQQQEELLTSASPSTESIGSISAAAYKSVSSAYTSPSSSNLSHQHQTLLTLAQEALGDASLCKDLVQHIFYWKVHHLVHASIDLKKVMQDIDNIFQVNPASTFTGSINSDDIIVCMMTIALSLQYLPKRYTPVNLIQRLSSLDEDSNTSLGGSPRLRQKLLFELSLNYIRYQMEHNQHYTYTHIQSLTLLLIYDQTGESLKDQIYDHAVRASQYLRLHCIVDDDGSKRSDIMNELKTRTWWFLVTRAWFASLASNIYSIHPHQISTRLPVENLYLDLPPNSPSFDKTSLEEVYLSSRYSFTLIKLANLIRRLVDYRMKGNQSDSNYNFIVQDGFEEFVEDLPPRYSLATKEDISFDDTNPNSYARRGKLGRFVLHQLLFHAYLELHQFHTTEKIPEACLSLANHIIDIQGTVSNNCYVLDSFLFNVKNIIKASSVLLVDLMQNGNTSSIIRLLRLRKVKYALNKAELQGLSRKEDFVQVRAMLELEENLWKQKRTKLTTTTTTTTISSSSSSIQSTPSSISTRYNNSNNLEDVSSLFAASAAEVPSPIETIPTPTANITASEVNMFSFLPSDVGIYPLFQAESNNAEWAQIYESFLNESNVK